MVERLMDSPACAITSTAFLGMQVDFMKKPTQPCKQLHLSFVLCRHMLIITIAFWVLLAAGRCHWTRRLKINPQWFVTQHFFELHDAIASSAVLRMPHFPLLPHHLLSPARLHPNHPNPSHPAQMFVLAVVHGH